MNDTRTPLIETRGLQKLFKLNGGAKLHAVDGIDLAIYQGETVGVVGVSEPGGGLLVLLSLSSLLQAASSRVLVTSDASRV